MLVLGIKVQRVCINFFLIHEEIFIDPLIETKNAVEHHLKNSENKFYECGVSSKQGEMELNVRS